MKRVFIKRVLIQEIQQILIEKKPEIVIASVIMAVLALLMMLDIQISLTALLVP